MMPIIEYQDLCDFSGLSTVRETCANRIAGFQVDNIEGFAVDGVKISVSDSVTYKNETTSADNLTVMRALHRLSQEAFKNLSHAFELPWEKYLGEMHDFDISSKDKLVSVKAGQDIPNEWSSLTIISNTSTPQSATILYGEALSVLSENLTSVPTGSVIPTNLLPQVQGDWLVYYVRLNEDVFYTRAAGALMTPLSTEEYVARKRVREIRFVV